MMTLKPDFLVGSIPPIVTPFKNGEVDYDKYASLLEFQIANGTHGILVNGTTSEPSTLTVDERNQLVELAVETVKGRVPVVAATGSQSHAETVALTEFATKAGADALLIVTPYYIRPPQRGLVEYYADLGKRTDLPMMIYHIPGRAAVNVELSTLQQICERVPTLVGMKHAVNDLGFVTQMLAAMGPQFRVFVGLEEFSFPMMAVGACGLMNAVANIAPRKVADLANATAAGNLELARRLHYELFELNQAVFYDTNPIPMKYMMKRLGLLSTNEHRLPMLSASPELEKRLDGVLQKAGLI
ncbi:MULTISPECIES: 4-hydroxy-tetrahydrodipicolinate synthase [unclassified Variovorax]|uniref:4-hydroxy-tetrahydrodipicolinate synthase n=1 Tax=unclassified Variovorax TaxID=663243 RepID=UPI002577948D|nr:MULTISPECIES: 4-hydroxy-tetrahydrodipicolinate synthase [unclassified Variovorax]MDM0066955.1 4-hydroxy-tetrahydrodipicolinate synthase [Variovorax sp. J31P207]MDM0084652.1 4-hydroxy-tetrahydrodipicolinate synthase [Variovorax sp. J31P179]